MFVRLYFGESGGRPGASCSDPNSNEFIKKQVTTVSFVGLFAGSLHSALGQRDTRRSAVQLNPILPVIPQRNSDD